MPGARCTRGLVCKVHRRKRTRAYRFSGGNPAFPAQWFTAYFVLSPVTGFLATVTSQDSSRETWRQHRGARTTRLRRPQESTLRLARRRVHRISPRVRDDREPPLLSGETGELVALICPTG